MSHSPDSAVLDRPVSLDDDWAVINLPSSADRDVITVQGRGRDRLYVVPAGRVRSLGRETNPLPPVDDLI